jgi:hypothetical protein
MESRIWFQIWVLKKLVLVPKMRANLDSSFFYQTKFDGSSSVGEFLDS